MPRPAFRFFKSNGPSIDADYCWSRDSRPRAKYEYVHLRRSLEVAFEGDGINLYRIGRDLMRRTKNLRFNHLFGDDASSVAHEKLKYSCLARRQNLRLVIHRCSPDAGVKFQICNTKEAAT